MRKFDDGARGGRADRERLRELGDEGAGQEDVLRLGIFPNLTHAPGYVALEEGIFEETLARRRGRRHVLQLRFGCRRRDPSGSIDATYIGPGPATALYLAAESRSRSSPASRPAARRSSSARAPASVAGRSGRARRSRSPGSATPRTSPSGPGCTSKGWRPTTRAARSTCRGRQPRAPRPLRGGSARRRLGARAVAEPAHRGGRRRTVRRRGRPVAGRRRS